MNSLPLRTPVGVFSEQKIKKRILLIALVYTLPFCVMIGRVVHLHLSGDLKLSHLEKSQYQKTVVVAPRRGNIYDSKGEELAIDIKVDSLYANPRKVNDKAPLAHQLASLINIKTDEIERLLNKDKGFVWLKRRLSPEESKKLEGFHHEALGVEKEYRRFYPNKKLAATILGAVGYDSRALGGLELFYDKILKTAGEPMIVEQDARGQSYSPQAVSDLENPHSVMLTLDKTIQFVTERELAHAMTQSGSKSGIAVVMESKTGAILAMASSPDFDPNQYSSYDLQSWKNRVVTDSFEPGSIFKAITAAAALESGQVSLTKKFNCEGGAYAVGKFTIHDHGSYGEMALPDIVRVSSNIGMFKVSQFIGKDIFSQAILNFGFGNKTGIDLPGEASGILSPASRWSAVQQGTIAFGQGISVTPLQLVTAYSAIANGGLLMRPFIVKKVLGPKGEMIRENRPQPVRRVISEDTSRKMTEILKLVVGPGGTATAAQVEEYGVAGKTGTAQKVSDGKGYAAGKFVASFIGFAPADDPRITILVSLNEPKGNHFGGVISAPPFREIVKQTLPYLGVSPRGNADPIVMTKNEEKTSAGEARSSKAEGKNEKSKRSEGNITQKIEPPLRKEEERGPVQIAEIEDGHYRIPDWTGKPMREILKNLDEVDLKLSVEGSGLCVRQEPAPGKLISHGGEVRLYFKPPS